MRKADDGANEHEEHSELGVHFILPNITQVALVYMLTTSPLAVIDEDQNRRRCGVTGAFYILKRKHRASVRSDGGERDGALNPCPHWVISGQTITG